VLRDRPWDRWLALEAAITLLAIAAFVGASLRLLDRRESVVLEFRGVLVRDHSDEFIPWGAIARVWPKGKNLVCISLHDPGRYPGHGWRRRLALRKPKGADIVIAMRGNEEQFEELLAAFNSWRPALIRDL